MSATGRGLPSGPRGGALGPLQGRLTATPNTSPASGKLRVDGVYGPATQQSVLTFQQVFHMPQTGEVDFATWYSISNIYVAVTGMA